MAATKKFTVIEGTHIEDKKKYKKGDVVESSRDLSKAFPLKFHRMPGSESAPAKTTADGAGAGGPSAPGDKGGNGNKK